MPEPVLSSLTGGGVQRVFELARRHPEMDVAFLAESTDGKQIYRGLDGDAESFGWQLGDSPPLPETYYRLMTRGDVPHVIPGARAHPSGEDQPVTVNAGIGSYVEVPIRLVDGTLHGSFCCLSHAAAPLDQRDVTFLAPHRRAHRR